MSTENSAKNLKIELTIENFEMIINFLDLKIDEILLFNNINKKFYTEIVPVMMLRERKDMVSNLLKWNGTRFHCSFRKRIVFMQNLNFYEIKELDDQMNKKISSL